MKGKKLLAGLLALALLVGLVPGTALAADEKTVWYYNDFESGDINTNANVIPKSNTIELYEDNTDNKAVIIEAGNGEDCYFEAKTKGISWDNVVVQISLSIDKGGVSGDMQFKDGNKKQSQLFNFSGNKVKSSGSSKQYGMLKKGEWMDLAFAIDFTDRTYTAYVNGEVAEENVTLKGECSKEFNNMRLYIAKKSSSCDILLDNFAIYEGTEPRDVSDEYDPDATTTEPAGPGQDYVLNTADMTKLDGGVALLLDNANAYAKNELTKVDPDNEAVVPFTTNDRTLVPVRFISESIGAEVGWDEATSTVTVTGEGKNITLTLGQSEMYVDGAAVALDAPADTYNDRTMLPLRALVEALGKNVYWDDRGLILITNSDITLDAEVDARLIGAMYGYLKTGKLALNYAVVPSYTQSIIDDAVKADLIKYESDSGNSSPGAMGSKALYYLALSEYLGMDLKATDGTTAKEGAIRQLESLLAGGNEPIGSVGPYWSHATVAADLVLVKNTPSIYNELTQDQKDRMDWLMKAYAVTGNWGFNDKNNYKTGTDLRGNFSKVWNPNYRNSYLPVVLSGAMYFGADELDEIFTSFSYDEYMAKFEEYGFTNLIASWEPAGKEAMENGGEVILLDGIGSGGQSAGESGGSGEGVKIPFTYGGKGLDQIAEIYTSLMKYTFGKVGQSSFGVEGEDDYCYITSGKQSPFDGYNGMMTEFAGGDGGGIRSNASYCYDSMMSIVPTLANMKLLGIWNSDTPEQQQIDSLMYVGIEDLIFKLQEGYQGYSTGSGHLGYEQGYVKNGYAMDKDLWRTFHNFVTEPTEIAPIPAILALPGAEPKDGVTAPPEGALVPGIFSASTFPAEVIYPFEKKTGTAKVEFDVVFGPDVNRNFDGVIMLDSADAQPGAYQQFNALIQFKSATINIMDAKSYKKTELNVYPNYRYHFRLELDPQTEKYSVWVTPTWPEQGEEVLVADDYSFRNSANEISDIGSIILVTASSMPVTYWVENLTVAE